MMEEPSAEIFISWTYAFYVEHSGYCSANPARSIYDVEDI